MPPNPLHSSESGEHYTPADYAERVRYVLGDIELDVASSRQANKVVKAKRIYTARQNALRFQWEARTAYCNAPGGDKTGQRVRSFWFALTTFWRNGDIGSAIWAGFNTGQLGSLQGYDAPAPQRFPLAFPSRRIRWLDRNLQEQKQPGHPNFFALLSDDVATWCRFREAFAEVGEIMRPENPCRRRVWP